MGILGGSVFLISVLTIGSGPKTAKCLDPELVREGPCIIPKPATNIDFNWLTSLKTFYFPGGSNYLIYKIASANPNFYKMNEYNLFYDSCGTVTQNISDGTWRATAFGTSMGTYQVTTPEPGVINFVPEPPVPWAGQTLQGVITLTDNKSFGFMYKCFLETNQRGWDVFTTSPSVMTLELEERIKRHAESLGLEKNNFQFLRYGQCQIRPEYENDLYSK